MNIAIFTDTFVPLLDGVVTFTKNLSKELANNGHKVIIICPKYKNFKEFEYKNIKVIRIKGVPALFYEGFKFTSPFSWKLLKIIKKEKIELIHFQTPISLGIEAILISKILKIPLIGTFHTNIANPEYLKHIRINNNYIQEFFWKYCSMFYNQADLITCPTETTKKELLLHGFKRPIKAISNGIDLNIFNQSSSNELEKKYNKKEKTLLFVGRVAHEKNISYLIDCFKIVLKKIPDAKLVIVGDGPQFKEIDEKIKNMKLSNNVILKGRIDHEKLLKSSIYKTADVFVTASTTETQGISTLEAQAHGLVSVAINEGGVKDIIKNNYNGFLIENNNKEEFAKKIIELLSNQSIYKKMRINTLTEIKKHDLKKVIKIYEGEYMNLIENHNKK